MAVGAGEAYQTLVGEGKVSHNLVYNSTSGEWELEEQSILEAVTSNLYVELADSLADYKLDDFDISGDPIYLGYQDKAGNYYIKRINIGTPAVDYTAGSSGYSTAWTNRATESYSDFASTF